ncbi:hypothetical protein CONCODRAFT_5767 [Conidiobolus coronatus NRRL 28638]|uniref:Uncharacterized protein n=1 Tax=Conidiobolus coronatus (strain ATCC 28846 / CBS 209.66 / NRRL 28638) TaxID=796925 RepID=A0A137P9D0_CONC2|nr:hypothetical protein CONCODRAFT_5767 [Conidiobolus coronatus NRRL 28638]|eukprot:KXN71511.1 hypothetical protein CONCODRAFT_5767 [Conidiobolus coronatus NRRL 28638]
MIYFLDYKFNFIEEILIQSFTLGFAILLLIPNEGFKLFGFNFILTIGNSECGLKNGYFWLVLFNRTFLLFITIFISTALFLAITIKLKLSLNRVINYNYNRSNNLNTKKLNVSTLIRIFRSHLFQLLPLAHLSLVLIVECVELISSNPAELPISLTYIKLISLNIGGVLNLLCMILDSGVISSIAELSIFRKFSGNDGIPLSNVSSSSLNVIDSNHIRHTSTNSNWSNPSGGIICTNRDYL